MFAVGHISLGYLLAKGSAKLIKLKNINLPLVYILSLIPDIDILIPFINHRTITHSIIVAVIVFIPVFMVYRYKAIPYFAALAQHTLIGDFITGGAYAEGTQIFWPLTTTSFGLSFYVTGSANITLEWTSFLAAGIMMFKTKDLEKLLKGQLTHLYLSVPMLAILLPAFLDFPLSVPTLLLIPHLAYLILFSISLLAVLSKLLRHPPKKLVSPS